MYVCMHVCFCVCSRVCMHVCMYVCMHVVCIYHSAQESNDLLQETQANTSKPPVRLWSQNSMRNPNAPLDSCLNCILREHLVGPCFVRLLGSQAVHLLVKQSQLLLMPTRPNQAPHAMQQTANAHRGLGVSIVPVHHDSSRCMGLFNKFGAE